jgi:hypothetical protein
MSTLDREHAEVLAIAIERGIASPKEAMDWACELVVAQTNPSEQVLELAGALHPHPLDVVAMLRRFPGSADPSRVFRKLLARIRDLLRDRPSAWPEVTALLEQMAIQGSVPSPLEGPCYSFDDQRLLAEQGDYGTVDEVHSELLAFLEAEAESPVDHAAS